MAVPIPLGYLRSRSASGNRMDVVLQSRTSKYGIGRIHPKTAAGHGCIALLLLSTVKNGGITNQRKTFGDALASRQGVQWMLADAFTELYAARMLTYDAARKTNAGLGGRMETFMVK